MNSSAEIDFNSIDGKAEDLRCAAERLSFGLESWDATSDLDGD